MKNPMNCLRIAVVLTAGFAVFGILPAPARTKFTVLHKFNGTDGAFPYAGLVRDQDGNLYGDTQLGGASNLGAVFKLDIVGNETVVYSFKGAGSLDGSDPMGTLIHDGNGNLYGTTQQGGIDPNGICSKMQASGCGVVFKLDTSGQETVLYSFTAGTDGASPFAGLAWDTTNNLYGTAAYGGAGDCQNGCGVVFKVDSAGNETPFYKFQGPPNDGIYPTSQLIVDKAGDLLGTTLNGGPYCQDYNCGSAFKLNQSGHETVLHDFAGSKDGIAPYAGLTMDSLGDVYGVTLVGGAHTEGTIFEIDRSGKKKTLYSFRGGSDGAYPYGGLVLDKDGNLYGATSAGGHSGAGVVFKLCKTGNESILHEFKGYDGANPRAALLMDASGNLYGTTVNGGRSSCKGGCGVVYKIIP